MLGAVCLFPPPLACREAGRCASPAGADGGKGLFATFCQESLPLPLSPSHIAVTKWVLGHSLVLLRLPIVLSFAVLCKPEAVPSHSAAGGHQVCCRVAFPLQ